MDSDDATYLWLLTSTTFFFFFFFHRVPSAREDPGSGAANPSWPFELAAKLRRWRRDAG